MAVVIKPLSSFTDVNTQFIDKPTSSTVSRPLLDERKACFFNAETDSCDSQTFKRAGISVNLKDKANCQTQDLLNIGINVTVREGGSVTKADVLNAINTYFLNNEQVEEHLFVATP